MIRLAGLLLVLILAACSQDQPLSKRLPVEVQRAWTLKETKTLESNDVPELVRSQGMRRAVAARYEGNGNIRLRVYEMNVGASAFELIQKWRQTDGLAIYKDNLFIVVESSDADQASVRGFLTALQESAK